MSIYYVYGFRDKKSGVVSNHFISNEPYEKVKLNISISLLNLLQREPNNPFILFSDDFDLVSVTLFSETDSQKFDDMDFVNLTTLLTASRNAYRKTHDQTSPDSELDETTEE